jgi:preprotein translocase subunit SecF
MGIFNVSLKIYDQKYKTLLGVSTVLLLLCISILFYKLATTGAFIEKGISLKGGLIYTIPVQNVNPNDLQERLATKFPKAEITVRGITERGRVTAITLEAGDVTEKELETALTEANVELKKGEYSKEEIGSALGESFFKQTILALILAFVAMSIVVYFTFWTIVPSLFVILTAASDIISTLAVLSLMEYKLTTAIIAALLMLIGYSVDTDILLTSRVLKRQEGTIFTRTVGALKTGINMTLSAVVAVLIGYIFTDSDIIKQIMLTLLIGGLFDVVYTWFQNAGILRWYLERKHEP